jgi:hypothetical protein
MTTTLAASAAQVKKQEHQWFRQKWGRCTDSTHRQLPRFPQNEMWIPPCGDLSRLPLPRDTSDECQPTQRPSSLLQVPGRRPVETVPATCHSSPVTVDRVLLLERTRVLWGSPQCYFCSLLAISPPPLAGHVPSIPTCSPLSSEPVEWALTQTYYLPGVEIFTL